MDSKLRIFVRPPSSAFKLACTLTGHENWIRGIAVCRSCALVPANTLWVASASQDRMVRLWTVEQCAQAGSQQVWFDLQVANHNLGATDM